MDLSLLLPVIGLIFTVVSKLLLLYSTTDKTSTLKMKSFSTVRVTQRGSQHLPSKRGGTYPARGEAGFTRNRKFSIAQKWVGAVRAKTWVVMSTCWGKGGWGK